MGMVLKKCIWKSLVSAILWIAFFCACTYAAEAQPKQPLKVAFPHAPGFSEVCPDGSRRGIVYEWLVEIAKYTGWEYEFVDGDNVEEILLGMYQGKYDLMGGMLKTPDISTTEDIWFYPKYLMGFNDSILIYRKDNEEIKNFDISTLDGKTIGVFRRAKAKIRRLKNILDFNHISCTIKEYNDTQSYERALGNKEVDLLLASDSDVTDAYNIALRFASEPSYIVAKKSNVQVCGQLDEAIEKIYTVNPNFGEELFQKYFPEKYKNSTQFTREELQFIQQSPPLKVAVVAKNNYPFYYELEQQPRGIVPGLLQMLSAETGLRFEYVEAASYTDAIKMVREGKADLLGEFINSHIAQNLEGLLITKNYAELDAIILRNKDANLVGENLIEAFIDDGALSARETERKKAAYFKSYADCLQAVDTGKADYAVIPMIVLEYLYTQDYYTNIVPAVETSKLYLALAMHGKADINLYTILTKAIVNTPEEQLKTVVSGNVLAAGVRTMSIKSLVYSNPVLSSVVIVSFLGLLVIIFFMYLWFKLQNRIAYAKLKQEKEMSKVRSEFLSRMSHEIRTPLNAIIGFINLLKFSKEGAFDVQKSMAKIEQSAKFLLSLVNDVLDMSKLENGKMQLETKPFEMRSLIGQLEDIFTAIAEEKQIKLQFVCKLPQQHFIGDEFRLKQVLINLLSNACKFTNRGGGIVVTVEQMQGQEAAAQLRFSVKDDGIGISKEDQTRIFDSFEQVVSQGKTSQQGTGLGLAISYNLVKLMHSNLCIESEIGQGSEFYFTVELPVYDGPFDEEAEEEAADPQFDLLRGKRILLAEDNDLNAEIAKELLELKGVDVEWVVNGQEAVDAFAQAAEGDYDIILMDLQMPVKGGLEATAEIRKLERADAKRIPIIAMTANALQEDREKAFAAGMSDFVPKPFDVEDLYKSIEKFFH